MRHLIWLLPLFPLLFGWILPAASTAESETAAAAAETTDSGGDETEAEEAESIAPAPPRAEGEGPYDQLILRGAILIDGTGSPPIGPVDIVVEQNRIAKIEVVGYPGVPVDEERRPELAGGGREIDLSGHYVLPGFVDLHGHIGGTSQGTPAEYVFKLWMGHGITTVRDPGCGNGVDFCTKHRARSARNEITAPRIHAWIFFGSDRDKPFTAPQQARDWVAEMEERGVDGFKFFGYRPDIMRAAVAEATARGLGTACHHAQLDVARVNVLDTSSWGLTTMEHWYGLPEALFTDRTVQDYPLDYNYQNEQHRFGQAGRLWAQAAERGSDRWNEVIQILVRRGFTLDPTLNIYEASRDLMRARRAEWHDEYTLPSLWDFYRPSRKAHGSYWFDWSTEDEVAWKQNYRKWMDFLVDYKNAGGRVTAGSDSGFIYQLYGFGYIRELELLREAGFHPLEVVRSATLWGAMTLGADGEIGSVEPGKLADLVIVEANPLANLKVLYGTGAIRLDDANVPRRVGGVKYTVKDGIVYDAKQLLADVREMVREAKEESGRELVQPGMPGDVPNLKADAGS
ncbi:MAG: amidohydrolase family protein [Thermoanaerobaculia bacterium]|nr:amidohydrolase family protein [Thermoanaerobaculia bacterium]